jgi:hypothetical protein
VRFNHFSYVKKFTDKLTNYQFHSASDMIKALKADEPSEEQKVWLPFVSKVISLPLSSPDEAISSLKAAMTYLGQPD